MRFAWLNIDYLFPFLTLLAAMLVACDTSSIVSSDPAHGAVADAASMIDAEAQRLLADRAIDVRLWLAPQHANHVVWNWNRAAALDALNELYRAGAQHIWVGNTTHLDRGAERASKFVVILPGEPSQRKQVFAWIDRWERDASIAQSQLTRDVGQKYYVINTDQ